MKINGLSCRVPTPFLTALYFIVNIDNMSIIIITEEQHEVGAFIGIYLGDEKENYQIVKSRTSFFLILKGRVLRSVVTGQTSLIFHPCLKSGTTFPFCCNFKQNKYNK